MDTCGYICPQCEGTGFKKDTLEVCDWCREVEKPIIATKKTISDEEWIEKVHAQNCCADIGDTKN